MSARPKLLVGDIGGTHGRFALAGDDLQPLSAGTEDGAAHATFADALEAYLEKSGATAEVAAFAVAGPVTDGQTARITNRRDWMFDTDALRSRFGFSRVIVMNDFVAQAASLPNLASDQVEPIGAPLPDPRGMKVAVGPGTGLGVAALAPEGAGWRPLPGEGGHVELAATTPREWAAFEMIRRALGRVEAEAVLSGPGLVRLHAALGEVDGVTPSETTAPEIVAAAVRGDSRAAETTTLFLAMLARFCGDLALIYAADGGVFVCGGVAPKMLGLFDHAAFRAAFEAKHPHDGLMRQIATCVVTAPNAGLIGCAAEARRRLAIEGGPSELR
jgi:glucokinase